MLLAVAIICAVVTPGALGADRHGSLGQGFYIPKEELLSSELTARGATIFEALPPSCIVSSPVATNRKDESFYSTTTSLYSAISTDTNLDLSLKGENTMGASVRAVTNNLATKDARITGSSLQLYAETMEYSISQDCINNQRFTKRLLKDFYKLNEVSGPWLEQSWRQYKFFFKKYGSHVVDSVLAGSSIYQYAFAQTDKDYSQRNFTVKSCASLAGPTDVGELGLSACSGISNNEINSVAKLKIVEKLVVRGGRAVTRSKLINARDKNTIQEFLQEAETDPSPTKYKFVPIWDILQARYIGTRFMARARNLEEYYKGFLDYGCSYQKTANGNVLQKFVNTPHSQPEFPSYQCMLGPTGCHEDNDCHYKDAFWCACAGQSCIRYADTPLSSGYVKTKAYVHQGLSPGWGWQGCKLSGLTCWCGAPSETWEITWRDDREHVLRNVHASMSSRLRKRAKSRIEDIEEHCLHEKL